MKKFDMTAISVKIIRELTAYRKEMTIHMIQMKDPESVVRDVIGKITNPERAAFWGALSAGFMTHLYVFVNKFYNYNELVAAQEGIGVAAQNNRWFLELMGRGASYFMGGSYSLPFWNGILTLIFLILSAMIVVHAFQLKNTVFSFCIGAVTTAFPAVISIYSFMFTSVFDAMGLFFSILAACLAIRHPGNILMHAVSALLLTCSLGTDQAYFPNTVCLFFITLILMCAFDERETAGDILKTGIRYLSVLFVSLAGYFITNKICLKIWNIRTETGALRGLDTMGSITPKELFCGVRSCYESFFSLAWREELFLNMRSIMQKGFHFIIFLLAACILTFLVIRRKEVAKNCLMLVFLLLFPVAMFLVYIMAPKAISNPLPVYPVVFFFVLFLVWTERFVGLERVHIFLKNLVQWAAAGVMCLLLFFYIWYGNGNYMAMEDTKYHNFAYLGTMATQIKCLEGYSDTLPVAWIGYKTPDETTAADLSDQMFSMHGKSGGNLIFPSDFLMITKYLGYDPEICDYETTQAFMETEEVREMPVYPADGSIRIVDGTIIVKLSEYTE